MPQNVGDPNKNRWLQEAAKKAKRLSVLCGGWNWIFGHFFEDFNNKVDGQI